MLPDQVFNFLCDFVLAHSLEEHQFTIHIEKNTTHYGDVISAEHLEWLRQHVKLEVSLGRV
jgi:hypothetical protein